MKIGDEELIGSITIIKAEKFLFEDVGIYISYKKSNKIYDFLTPEVTPEVKYVIKMGHKWRHCWTDNLKFVNLE